MLKNCKVVSIETLPSDYFATDKQRGRVDYPVSSSLLREFAKCPQRWLFGYTPPESTAKDWGSLFDCLSLTPAQFEKRYAVQPNTYKNEKGEVKPWNNNATVCKEWSEEQIGREIIAPKELKNCERAVLRMMQDDVIKAWFEASDRQVWVQGQWHDDATKLIVPVRCLIDFAPQKDSEFCKCLGDLKSTRTASVMAWQRDCFQMGYHVQAAFDTDLYVAATGEDRNTWCFILSESFEPWQTGKRMLSQDFLTLGREEYTKSLANYCACLKAGRWPGYDDSDEAVQGWSIVSPEPWMQSRAMFSPKLDFGATVEPETEPETDEDIIP